MTERKGSKPKEAECHRLTKKQVQELLKQTGLVQDDLGENVPSYPHYALPDGGELVVLSGGDGLRFTSRADYIAEMEELRNRKPEHVLEGLLPQRESFPQGVPELIDRLARIIGVEREKLDGSLQSLTLLDRLVRRLGPERSMTAEFDPLLVAYVVEVMRQATGGTWRMKRAGEDLWEPWIVADDDWYNPFMTVYRELDEGRGGSIAGATRGRLRRWQAV
jgi:hypothetical protein